MRIALTGATGFVGEHVLPRLLARGWEVSALARCTYVWRKAMA